MTDREKVIKGLEVCMSGCCHPKDCPYYNYDNCGAQVKIDALALLKEQEAVEARKECDGTPQPWTSWWYVCGNCKASINPNDKYCHECGRPVKWND